MKEKKFKRVCPQCKEELFYTQMNNRDNAEKSHKVCNSCSKIGMYDGEKNPFYGKRHSKEIIEILRENSKITSKERSQTPEFKKWFGENIANRASVYDIWVKKYGEEKARKLQNEKNLKHSKKMSGSGNSMYGKPSPVGSGNGWSGWYKDWYFRSLLELSFMIEHIEKNGDRWESGESKKLRIKYMDRAGKSRNYFVDFILNDKTLVEIKPKNLLNSESVKLKIEAGKNFAITNGYEYIILEPVKISKEKVKELHDCGLLKFLPRYEKKYLEQYGTK